MKRLVIFLALLAICSVAYVADSAVVVKPYVFTNGAVADANQVNSDFDTLYTLVNGNLDPTNFNPSIGLPLSFLKCGSIADCTMALTQGVIQNPTVTSVVQNKLNCPSGQSVDCAEWALNGTLSNSIDAAGNFRVGNQLIVAPLPTSTPTAPAAHSIYATGVITASGAGPAVPLPSASPGDMVAMQSAGLGKLWLGGITGALIDFASTVAGDVTINKPLALTTLTASKNITCTDSNKALTSTCTPTLPFFIERKLTDPITTSSVAYIPLPTGDNTITAVAVQFLCTGPGSGTNTFKWQYTATTTNAPAASYTDITGATATFTTATSNAPATFTPVNLSGVSAAYVKLVVTAVGSAPTGCSFYLHLTHVAV